MTTLLASLLAKAPMVARSLFGLTFLVFGLNGFLNFLPQPPLPAEAGSFIGGLVSAKYLFPLLKGTEVVAGALLLSGRFVPLALTLLAPIIVNIVGFHVALAPSPGMVVFLLGTELYLAWAYRDAFRPLFQARSEPTAAATTAPQGRYAQA